MKKKKTVVVFGLPVFPLAGLYGEHPFTGKWRSPCRSRCPVIDFPDGRFKEYSVT